MKNVKGNNERTLSFVIFNYIILITFFYLIIKIFVNIKT